MDSYVFILIWSQTYSLLTVGEILLPPKGSGIWDMWDSWLPVKNKASKLLSISAFSMAVVGFLPSQLLEEVHSSRTFSSDQCTYRIRSCYFPYLLQSSLQSAPWFSSSPHLQTESVSVCIILRLHVPTSTACSVLLILQFNQQLLAQTTTSRYKLT